MMNACKEYIEEQEGKDDVGYIIFAHLKPFSSFCI